MSPLIQHRSLHTYCKGYTVALLGPLMPFHLSDHFPRCMRQETVEDAPSYAFWDLAPPQKGLPTVKEKPLPKQLLRLKAKTSWSWERMCREFHRVMGYEGPTHTTLFRYASGRVKRPYVVTERYVRQAIDKLTVELSQK